MTSKGPLIGAAAVLAALFGVQFYGLHSSNANMNSRFEEMQNKLESIQAANTERFSNLESGLNSTNEKVTSSSQDFQKSLQQSQKAASALKKEQSQYVTDLHTQLEEHAKQVDALRAESTAKLEEVKQETSTKLGAVNGDVKAANGQIEGVKSDLAATRNDLAANRKEIGDVRDSLGRQIAHNESELDILKRRGERNYVEFTVDKNNKMQRVGDIQMQLTKADSKAQRFDVNLLVSDTKLQKKNQIVNEPVPLLVGQNRLRYELVVNSVEKDRIRGYISTPKDASLNGEGPTAR